MLGSPTHSYDPDPLGPCLLKTITHITPLSASGDKGMSRLP